MCNSTLNIAGMNFIKLKSMTISVVLDHTINLVLKLFFYHNCIMEIVLCHYNAYNRQFRYSLSSALVSAMITSS